VGGIGDGSVKKPRGPVEGGDGKCEFAACTHVV
jgi:hypothetical protein